MPFRAILLACLLSAPAALAQAQGPRVLALAPAHPDPDWPGNLAIELAPVGGQVLRSPLVAGPSAEDPRLAARVAAQVVGAEAAVWLAADGRSVHVVLAASRHGFEAPLSGDADARTVALVAASLLEEAFANATPTGTPLASTAEPPRSALDRPIEPAPQAGDRERAPVNRALPAAAEPSGIVGFGAFGTGGLAWMNDAAFDPGTFVRGILGLRIGTGFQVQASVEVGMLRERIDSNFGLELQPFGRLCPEVVWVIPVDDHVGFHLAAHGCVGVAELRYFDGFDGLAIFWLEGPVITAAGGGYLGLEVRPSQGVSVTFRADLDGSAPVLATSFGGPVRDADVIASFSTMVGFW